MISLIIGPMFSGKTTEIVRLLTRHQIAGEKVLLCRHRTDTRGILTHTPLSHKLEEIFLDSLAELQKINDFESYKVIGVDEGQFFPNLARDVSLLANNGYEIIIAGLNATSEQSPFEEIQKVIPIAEKITKLNSVCMKCGNDFASFTYYKGKHKEGDVLVGDEKDYSVLCRKCLNETHENGDE